MAKRSVIIVVWVLLSVILVVKVTAQDAPTASSHAGSIESVCYVVAGGLSDSDFVMPGITQASEEFGLEMIYVETGASYEEGIETCLVGRFAVVITVFDQNLAATVTAAEANPDVYFVAVGQVIVDGPANVQGILFREDQAGFLAGALAASMSESETVAGVYGIAVPAVVKFRNGFEQGVRYVNPNIEALGVYLDSFTAPDRGAAAAEQFIGEGADVIFGAAGRTGSGGILYAAQEGVRVIGVDRDEYLTTFAEGETPGAENLLTSAVKDLDMAIYQTLRDLREGGSGWIGGGNLMMSLENGGVGLAPWHEADVPEEVQTRLEKIQLGLADGSIETGVDPLTGELTEEANTSEPASGDAAQDTQISIPASQTVEVTAGDGLTLVGHFYTPPAEGLPEEGAPAVLLLHGNMGTHRDWLPLIEPLLQAGYHALAVEERGMGSGCCEPDWLTAVGDVQSWMDWLKAQPNVQADNLAIVGERIGAHLAINGCSNDPTCIAVVAFSPGCVRSTSPNCLDGYRLIPGLQELSEMTAAVVESKSAPPIFIAVTQDNPGFTESAKTMAALSQSEFSLWFYLGGYNSISERLREQDGLIDRIIGWLDQHAPPA